MISYLIKRLFSMVITLFCITVVIFLILSFSPIDPAEMAVRGGGGEEGTQSTEENMQEAVREMEKHYNLDKPRFLNFDVLEREKHIERVTEELSNLSIDQGESQPERNEIGKTLAELKETVVEMDSAGYEAWADYLKSDSKDPYIENLLIPIASTFYPEKSWDDIAFEKEEDDPLLADFMAKTYQLQRLEKEIAKRRDELSESEKEDFGKKKVIAAEAFVKWWEARKDKYKEERIEQLFDDLESEGKEKREKAVLLLGELGRIIVPFGISRILEPGSFKSDFKDKRRLRYLAIQAMAEATGEGFTYPKDKLVLTLDKKYRDILNQSITPGFFQSFVKRKKNFGHQYLFSFSKDEIKGINFLFSFEVKSEEEGQALFEKKKNSIDEDNLLFEMGSEETEKLNDKKISSKVRKKFEDYKQGLSDKATTEVLKKGQKWKIIDGDKSWIVAKKGDKLRVYTEEKKISEELGKIFAKNGLNLSDEAVIESVTRDREWKIFDGENTWLVSLDDLTLRVYKDRQQISKDLLSQLQEKNLSLTQAATVEVLDIEKEWKVQEGESLWIVQKVGDELKVCDRIRSFLINKGVNFEERNIVVKTLEDPQRWRISVKSEDDLLSRYLVLVGEKDELLFYDVSTEKGEVLKSWEHWWERNDHYFINLSGGEKFARIFTHTQYGTWIHRLFQLDFGESWQHKRPVTQVILERIPVSLQLAVPSFLLIYLMAIPLGVFSATNRDTALDQGTTLVLFILYSLPSFWIALLLIQMVATKVGLPIQNLTSTNYGEMDLMGQVWDRFTHLVLPVFCMTYAGLAYISRQMRAAMLESINQDYTRTARAKGLWEKIVIWKHVFWNSTIPILTLLAGFFPVLLGGSVIIEVIFGIQGMGKASFEAVLQNDRPMVMTIMLCYAVLTLIGILVVDILYAFVDPRISYD